MATYRATATKDSYPYATDYKDELGNPKPESIRVSATRLAVGDIVLISTYEGNVGYTYRSSVVSGIERNPKPTYSDKWKITLVDEKGKVDVFKVGDGKIYQFERQCSQETKENAEERLRNISLRRDIQRLERAVHRMLDEVGWLVKNGKNPKMPGYAKNVADFALALDSMYDDVGADLGLPPRAKKKRRSDV